MSVWIENVAGLNKVFGTMYNIKNRISRAFDLMGIAEEEIAAAKKRHPGHRDDIHKSFLLVQPHDFLVNLADDMFRASCREILDRVAGRPWTGIYDRVGGKYKVGIDYPDTSKVEHPTAAELAAAFSAMSLHASLSREYSLAYAECIVECIGPQKSWKLVGREWIEQERKNVNWSGYLTALHNASKAVNVQNPRIALVQAKKGERNKRPSKRLLS